jgi:hypothetical protein
MATDWNPNLKAIPLDESITLMVAWRDGATVEGAMVPIAGEVADEVRDACSETLERLEDMALVAYGSDAHLELNEFMAVPIEVVENDARAVLKLLGTSAALDSLSPEEIPSKLWFYAAVVGDDPEHRVAFVRKTDPHLSAKSGRFFTTFGEVLSRIEEPVFVLEHWFDLIVLPDGLVVLNPVAFETLFRGAPGLALRIPDWAKGVTDNLPMDDVEAEKLVSIASRNSVLARKLRSIYERGHLANVTINRLRKAIREQGLDTGKLIKGGKLVLDEDDPKPLFQLLNEDLFLGGLTGTRFAADRKRTL